MEKLKLLWLVAAMALMFATAGLLYAWLNRSEEVFIINQYTEEEPVEEWDYLSDFYLEEESEVNETESEQKSVSLLFFGDLMIDRNVGEIINAKGLDSLFVNLKNDDLFSNRHIISANLEGAVTNEGNHYPPNNAYDFAFKPELIAQFKNYGFNYFSLANNHLSDQGKQGIEESRKNLSTLQFYYSGAEDAVLNEYSREDIIINDQNFSFIAMSMVYNNFDIKQAQNIIKLASEESDYVIVNIHWGNEYQHNFNAHQQDIGHRLIDAGADIIIGHHPHVVQGMEIYKNKPIFYSLGNFIFDQYFSDATQEGLAIGLEVKKDEVNISLLPHTSTSSVPQFLKHDEAYDFINKFVSWSQLSGAWPDRVQSGSWVMTR